MAQVTVPSVIDRTHLSSVVTSSASFLTVRGLPIGLPLSPDGNCDMDMLVLVDSTVNFEMSSPLPAPPRGQRARPPAGDRPIAS